MMQLNLRADPRDWSPGFSLRIFGRREGDRLKPGLQPVFPADTINDETTHPTCTYIATQPLEGETPSNRLSRTSRKDPSETVFASKGNRR